MKTKEILTLIFETAVLVSVVIYSYNVGVSDTKKNTAQWTLNDSESYNAGYKQGYTNCNLGVGVKLDTNYFLKP